MFIDHPGELFDGPQPLPLELLFPVFEKSPRPPLAVVISELSERLLEQISRIQALVGSQKGLESLAGVGRQVLAV